MFPSRALLRSVTRQSGSMLVISIFVIVVMSLLGIAMIRMLTGAADSGLHEVYGFRALNAAQSGIEAKMAQVFPLTIGGYDAAQCSDVSATINFGNTVAGLENCSFTHNCERVNPDTNLDYLRFSSTGQCVAGDIVTSRTLLVDAKVEL